LKVLEDALRSMRERGGSNLHYKANVPIYMRIDGELVRSDLPRPAAENVERAVHHIFKSEEIAAFQGGEELRTTYEGGDGERYRVSAFLQRGSPGLVLRYLPRQLPDPESLGVPEVVRNFPRLRRGLVVVTGPARCGKSTTLATILQEYRSAPPARILTLENPVEYRLEGAPSLLTQRQVGTDTESFRTGLEAARRLDPDVLVLGQLPDADTLFHALSLASSGVLCYLAMPASSAVRALERIVSRFPISRRDQVLTRLSICLRAVYCQHLVEGAAGGKLPAFELLVPDPEVRQRIKSGHFTGMGELLDRLRGCFGLVASIKALLQKEKITREEALRRIQELRPDAVAAAEG